MRERCLDELLLGLRTIAARGDEWSRNFARSILRQAKRTSWRPSPKQHALMHRLVSEMFVTADLFEEIGNDGR